ncbi:Ig-like domain-containing protein [Rummeliibacillus suwonensis]|uniref:Ig-like domain-containing protein n=1 Tax=Rummeliibacillus suwonensis TaxID=1306154 RepID=UPI001AAEDC34|nr:Ig-like domain-containing protein [Rummeliibacillus suwonensis]MBO2535682.1 hypothetical protein [Rummeliibacillus suwonensis]
MKKVFLTIAIAFFISFGLSFDRASADGEVNLSLGQTISGIITDDDTIDYYKITIPKAGKLSLEVSSYMEWLDVELYDENHDIVISEDNFSGADDNNPIPWKEGEYLEAGTYTVKVSQDSDYTGKYSIKSTFKASNNNEIESNNGTDIAQSLTLNKTKVTGQISWNDSADYYKVTLTKPGYLSVLISSYMEYLNVELLDADYNQIKENYYFDGANESTAIPESLSTYLEKGTYYVKISRDDYNGLYKLQANFSATNNNEKESNNGVDQAQTLKPNIQKITGLISWNDSTDFYKVDVKKSGKLNVNIASYMPYLDVTIYNKNMESMNSEYSFYGATSNTAITKILSTDVKAGTYYIEIKEDDYLGKYKLSASVPQMLPKPPKVYTVKKGAKSISGVTYKNSAVTVKIGSKKYTGKSTSNGKFKIKIPRQKANAKIYINVKTSAGTSPTKKVVVKR